MTALSPQALVEEGLSPKDLLSLQEVADLVGVSKKTVLRRVEAGELRASRLERAAGIGWCYRVQWGELLNWVARGEP